MNIIVSTCLLSGALCALCWEIGKLVAALNTKPVKRDAKQPKKERRAAAKAQVDWDRVMKETRLEKESDG